MSIADLLYKRAAFDSGTVIFHYLRGRGNREEELAVLQDWFAEGNEEMPALSETTEKYMNFRVSDIVNEARFGGEEYFVFYLAYANSGVLVRSDHMENAFEELADWADDNGHMGYFEPEDEEYPDTGFMVGHTTLQNWDYTQGMPMYASDMGVRQLAPHEAEMAERILRLYGYEID